MRKLTEVEWESLSLLISRLHLDESFDIWSENNEDCFMDMEDGSLKSLEWGLELLEECIAYPLKHERLTDIQTKAVVNLFKEFCIGNEEWYKWLLLNAA